MGKYWTIGSYDRPSATRGFARLVDIFGTMNDYSVSKSGEDPDLCAIASDWHQVGQDLQQAINVVKEEDIEQ